MATGYSNREISEQLYITERTVKNHVNSILRRLNLRDRTQAAIFANTHINLSIYLTNYPNIFRKDHCNTNS